MPGGLRGGDGMKRKLSICGILLGMLLASGCGGKQENDWKDLESVFGKTQEEAEEILGWNLATAKEESLSDQTMDGYALKLENTNFLGQKAEQVYVVFMEDLSGTLRLTLLYADYPDGETMDPAAEELRGIWGEERSLMYCSWPDMIYWPQGLWAGGNAYNDPANFNQTEKTGKRMWGNEETVGELLSEEEEPMQTYENWIRYARTYVQSLKNDWNQVREEPSVTAVLFESCEDFGKENVVIIDGFQKFMGTHMTENT